MLRGLKELQRKGTIMKRKKPPERCPLCKKATQFSIHQVRPHARFTLKGVVSHSVTTYICQKCEGFFSRPVIGKCRYDAAVIAHAVRLSKAKNCEAARRHMLEAHKLKIAPSTLYRWRRQA